MTTGTWGKQEAERQHFRCQQEGWREGTRGISQPTPGDILPPEKLLLPRSFMHLLPKQHHQLETKYLNIGAFGRHLLVKTPRVLTILNGPRE